MLRHVWLLALLPLLLPATSYAVQLHWSGGATDLTVNDNGQAVLVVSADSAEAIKRSR